MAAKAKLTARDVEAIVGLYGSGESIPALAQAYKVSGALIRLRLKEHGALRPSEGKTMDAAAESDEALGIGDDDGIGAVSVDDLMTNPAFSKLIEAAVARKLAQMGHAEPKASKSGQEAAFDAFLSKFDHMLEVQAEQRPGYIKPLSADEVDARREGRVEMFAILKRCKERDEWPHYLLGDTFYGPSPNGPILYEAGQEIKTRLPPSDHFRPLNESAVQVYAAYKRWVGEVLPISELIAQAAADARGTPRAPEVEHQIKTLEPEVMLVDAPRRDVAPSRVLGTITPELRGKTMPGQPGVAAQPSGPIFVAA